MNRGTLVALALALFSAPLAAQETLTPEQIDFFERRIRPVLVEHCYQCHSQQSGKAKGGLRLDTRETTLAGGDSGPAIIAGDVDQSLLIEALRYESLEMPPDKRLPTRIVDHFVRWVQMGAPDPRTEAAMERPDVTEQSEQIEQTEPGDHWAFRPLRDSTRPSVQQVDWPTSDVDYFILSRLEACGLQPATDADRYVWLRRVSLDLTGLPPTEAEIRVFVTDSSPSAYERVVDRLLASRAFGERWARHWLDLVGYADQVGTSNNVFAQHAWRYRDYVIDAFNRDLPFDRFAREQIAGDLIQYPSVTDSAAAITATGFLVLGDLEIVEADKAKMRVDIVDQQVVKTSKAFLGMTLGCARCHDHKFDPISQRDYYAMAGFFWATDSVYKTDRGVWSDVIQRELPETVAQQTDRQQRARIHAQQLEQWQAEKAELVKRRDEIDAGLPEKPDDADVESEVGRDDADQSLKAERAAAVARIARLDKLIAHAQFFTPDVPRAHGVADAEQPADMQITIRGNPHALGDEVPRGFIEVVSGTWAGRPSLEPSQSGRIALADWITDPNNPLTARVTVNRIWQKLFGQGIAPSADYFGVRAPAPSHPDLLDHLATNFIADGWSQKSLIRSLVLSRTYRMSSDHNDQSHAVDPDNRLLWRMNRRRLDAEALRDAMLAVSRQLHRALGQQSMPLEFVENVNNIDPENVNPPSFALRKWRDDQKSQRTIYLPIIRSGAQPGPAELRNVFDFPQPAEFVGRRPVTAVPTQALFLMNSPVVRQHATELAKSIQASVVADDQLVSPLPLLWMRTLNRPVTEAEQRQAEAFLQRHGDEGLIELCHALLATNEFLMTL